MPFTGNISEEFIIQKRIEVGAQLRAVREQRGLSEEQLAEISNLQVKTIRKMEAGLWNYNINDLIIYSTFLEFDINLVLK